jgi:hypothetical protein
MRNRNTIEFLGTWELLHNSAFKGVEFDTFLHEAGATYTAWHKANFRDSTP